MIERERKSFTFSPFVTMCLQEGGYVAGGAARALFLRKDMQDYFQIGRCGPVATSHPISDEARLTLRTRRKPSGDVDIFFRTREQYDAAVERASQKKLGEVEMYNSDLSKTYNVRMRPPSPSGVTAEHDLIAVQLIHCIFGPPEDMISGFDIVNSSIAVDADGFIYDSALRDLEDKATLKIQKGDATKLLARVSKYMTYRDLTNLDDSTHDMISEWLLRYLSKDFVGPTAHLIGRPSEDLLRSLMSHGVMERTHLVYLLNREEFTKNIMGGDPEDGYSIIGKRDLITDLIGTSGGISDAGD